MQRPTSLMPSGWRPSLSTMMCMPYSNARSRANLEYGVAPVKRIGLQQGLGHILLRCLLELVRAPDVVELLQKLVVGENRQVLPTVRQNIRVAKLRFHGAEATQNVFDLTRIDHAIYFANFA